MLAHAYSDSVSGGTDLEHESLHRVDDHPERGQRLSDQLLPLLARVAHVEHDVADDVVVEGEGGLLRQLGDEADEGAQHLERLRRVVARQLLHEELEEEVAVLDEALPDHLVGHLVDGGAVERDGLVVEQRDDLHEGRAERRGEERLRQVVAALAHHHRLQVLVGRVLVH